MNAENQAVTEVGVEMRAGRPWFAVCCASCLVLLVALLAGGGFLIDRFGLSERIPSGWMNRLLKK